MEAGHHLYKFMHEHGQQMEDIEAHLGVLHNSFMEVNNCPNDSDTNCCRCGDVPLTFVVDEPHVSPLISAVGGGEEVVKEGLLTIVGEEEVPFMIQVCGQTARRSRSFCVNFATDPHKLV